MHGEVCSSFMVLWGGLPICFLLGQVTPKAAPSMEHKQPAPTIQPAQQPHPLPAEPAVQHETPGAPELEKATQQGIGTQSRRLAKSTLRAVQRLKHSAADATEELLLRSRALLPRSLSSLLRFVQVPIPHQNFKEYHLSTCLVNPLLFIFSAFSVPVARDFFCRMYLRSEDHVQIFGLYCLLTIHPYSITTHGFLLCRLT